MVKSRWQHAGSTACIILGILGLTAIGQVPKDPNQFFTVFAGFVLLLSGLSYRSRKRVRLGQQKDSVLRNSLEIGAFVLIAIAIFAQNDLYVRLMTQPVSLVILPTLGLLAYVYIRFSRVLNGG